MYSARTPLVFRWYCPRRRGGSTVTLPSIDRPGRTVIQIKLCSAVQLGEDAGGAVIAFVLAVLPEGEALEDRAADELAQERVVGD